MEKTVKSTSATCGPSVGLMTAALVMMTLGMVPGVDGESEREGPSMSSAPLEQSRESKAENSTNMLD